MTAPKQDGVSIVIPAYNEEKAVGDVLDHLVSSLEASGLLYEVVVVDDGSEDDTAAVLARRDDVRLIRNEQNGGYGFALKAGIRHARYPLVCITDADGTYPNERIPELVAHLRAEELDMVVGARTGSNVSIPLIRRPAKWFIRKLAEVVADQRIPDINSGLRVFKRDVSLRFFKLLPSGFSFTTTITLALLTNAYRVAYIPIDYHARVGQSKIRPIRDTLNFIQLILRMALYFAPLKIFLSISLALALFTVLWGIFSAFVLGALADDSTFTLAVASLQVAMLGLLAELINQRLPNSFDDDES